MPGTPPRCRRQRTAPPHQWASRRLPYRERPAGPGIDFAYLKNKRQRIARAYGDGAYTDEDYQMRLNEIDAKITSAIPISLPSIEAAAELLDDLPGLWQEALPEERRRLLAPLIDRVYLDLKTKRVAGIKPKPGFEELLGNAVYRTNESTCALLNRDEVESLFRFPP